MTSDRKFLPDEKVQPEQELKIARALNEFLKDEDSHQLLMQKVKVVHQMMMYRTRSMLSVTALVTQKVNGASVISFITVNNDLPHEAISQLSEEVSKEAVNQLRILIEMSKLESGTLN